MTDYGEELWTASIRDVTDIGGKGTDRGLAPAIMSKTAGVASRDIAIIDSNCLTRECLTDNITCLVDHIRVFSFRLVSECNSQGAGQYSLIILHLHAAEHDPLELIKSLHSVHNHSAMFLLADLDYHAKPDFLRAAWRLGARGFVSPRTTGLTLALSAIRFVQAGGFFAPVDAMLSRTRVPPEPPPMIRAASGLTPREIVVLRFLKEGKTNKVIARELRLSSNTIKVHVYNILRKTRARNRFEAATWVQPAAAKYGAAHANMV